MPRAVAVVTVVTVVTLAACTAAPATPDPEPDGRPALVTATVTAAQLGPGSIIAVVSNTGDQGAPPAEPATSLEVITPDGVRHPVWSVALTEDDGYLPGDFELADWRPDLHTALLRVQRGGPVPDRVVSYDLVTGGTHEVTLPRKAISAALDPDGTGILMTLYGKGPAGRIVAQGWDGERTRLPGTTGGRPLTSVDGRTLVSPAGDRTDWWVVDLPRHEARTISPPGSCDPIRWLDDDRVLASCYAEGGNRLTSVDLHGGSARLGPLHPIDDAGTVDVIADGDVVRVGGGRWYVTWRGRGTGVLTEQQRPGGRTRVPGTAGLLSLRRVPGDRLLLARSDSHQEHPVSRSVLELLDPATRTREVVVRLARGEAWRAVIGATDVRAWNA
jgi:hypothetical protein